jgi:hypothetical protein
MTKASEYQPDPKQGEQVVVDVVLADIRERAETGKRKYGTYLETNNGRNPLWDAYQEAIDLVMYLRQALLEQERHLTPVAADSADGPCKHGFETINSCPECGACVDAPSR